MQRTVTSHVTGSVLSQCEIALSVGARGAELRYEELSITVDGSPVPAEEVHGPQGA